MFTVFEDLNQSLDATLERQFIFEHLRSAGFPNPNWQNLPEDQKADLMRKACMYASLRMAEIDAKSSFSRRIKKVSGTENHMRGTVRC